MDIPFVIDNPNRRLADAPNAPFGHILDRLADLRDEEAKGLKERPARMLCAPRLWSVGVSGILPSCRDKVSEAGKPLAVSALGELAMDGPTTGPETSVAALRELLKTGSRAERLRRMSPERRALYEQILKRRDEIGRLPGFDALRTLRELRGNG